MCIQYTHTHRERERDERVARPFFSIPAKVAGIVWTLRYQPRAAPVYVASFLDENIHWRKTHTHRETHSTCRLPYPVAIWLITAWITSSPFVVIHAKIQARQRQTFFCFSSTSQLNSKRKKKGHNTLVSLWLYEYTDALLLYVKVTRKCKCPAARVSCNAHIDSSFLFFFFHFLFLFFFLHLQQSRRHILHQTNYEFVISFLRLPWNLQTLRIKEERSLISYKDKYTKCTTTSFQSRDTSTHTALSLDSLLLFSTLAHIIIIE
jgi:hypothetical protein